VNPCRTLRGTTGPRACLTSNRDIHGCKCLRNLLRVCSHSGQGPHLPQALGTLGGSFSMGHPGPCRVLSSVPGSPVMTATHVPRHGPVSSEGHSLSLNGGGRAREPALGDRHLSFRPGCSSSRDLSGWDRLSQPPHLPTLTSQHMAEALSPGGWI
jgi:hypothetical protein